jgi:homoserine kinase
MTLALSNTYRFESAKTFGLDGFDQRFIGDQNLVLKAYQKTFQMLGKEASLYPVMITERRQDIPVSRGLGSSSACVIAGIYGALWRAGEAFDKEKIMAYATAIEGHPDNAAAVIYGGLVTMLKTSGGWLVKSHLVDRTLRFTILVPNFEIKTKDARSRLPHSYLASDVTHVLSRALFLTYAFESGDLSLIGHVFDDVIHEPYRYPMIQYGEEIKAFIQSKGGMVAISGSGPSLLVVSRQTLDLATKDLDAYGSWHVIHTDVMTSGVQIKLMEEK